MPNKILMNIIKYKDYKKMNFEGIDSIDVL